nr:hypothetical protein [bacterium]
MDDSLYSESPTVMHQGLSTLVGPTSHDRTDISVMYSANQYPFPLQPAPY